MILDSFKVEMMSAKNIGKGIGRFANVSNRLNPKESFCNDIKLLFYIISTNSFNISELQIYKDIGVNYH